MSQGGPLSEPLSGLVVYVCIPGAAPGTTLAEPTTTLCRASGEERALGKLHYAAAANSPASSAPPLWEKLAPIRQRACGEFRSLLLRCGALGGFERRRRGRFPTDPWKTRFFVAHFCLWSEFESAARSRGLGLGYAVIVHP